MADVFRAAPGRGQYDRRQPRAARLLEQRDRLVAATARVVAATSGETSVAAVVKLAGVSRNTFYEYFDDLEHARVAAEGRARQRLEVLLRDAEARSRTPVERWRALSHAWIEWVSDEPSEARLCLREVGTGLSGPGRMLEAALARSLQAMRAAGVSAGEPDTLRLTAVAAAAEAFARSLATLVTNKAFVRDEPKLQQVERALIDVAVRLLR